MKVMSFNHMPLVRLDAPEWFQREDWMAWLNNRTPMNHPATWHVEGTKPNEYSDVFFTYCDGDGSDYGEGKPSIPDDIWSDIDALLKVEGIDECLVWVSNLGVQ